jgi:hypothetical protein
MAEDLPDHNALLSQAMLGFAEQIRQRADAQGVCAIWYLGNELVPRAVWHFSLRNQVLKRLLENSEQLSQHGAVPR